MHVSSPFTTVGEATRRRLGIVFAVVALAALYTAAAGTIRAAGEIGRPFGGFAWTKGWRDLYWVYPITPHDWPGLAGLMPLDIIISANGQPPSALPEVFSGPAGAPITYEVERFGQPLTITIPTVTFTATMLWELNGPLILCGVAAVAAALALLRRTRDRPLVIVAGFLLVSGALQLIKVDGPRLSSEYGTYLFENIIWTFGYPIAGALMWHFTLVFPRARRALFHHPWLISAIYGLAVGLGALYAISDPPIQLTRPLEEILFPAALAFAWTGLAASVIGGALAYRFAARTEDTVAAYKVRRLALAWLAGVFLYSYLGITVNVAAGFLPILTELLLPMTVLYPVLLVYALLSMQQVEELRRQVNVVEAMRDELGELRAAREQVLNQVAEDLHAYVLPDIRGLQMSLQAAAHYGKTPDADYVAKTLDNVYRMARRIMEGAKPVNLEQDQLVPTVQRVLQDTAVTAPGLAVELQCETWDEECPLAVKEEIYRIIQTAVTNARDHAEATRLVVTLEKDADCIYASVRDDGRGFDVAHVLRPGTGEGLVAASRRHMGVRGIQARAEALGGQATIESGVDGTEITVILPRVTPRSEAGIPAAASAAAARGEES